MPQYTRDAAASRFPVLVPIEAAREAAARPSGVAVAAHELLALLNPCRTTYIHWWGGRGAQKRVRQVHQAVTVDAVVQHLSPVSLDGPGSLGFFLEYPGPGSFETSTIALDLDQYNLGGLRTLVDTLHSHDIRAYATRGSSGRGHHVYVLFHAPIPLSNAYAALRCIADMARASGFDKVEIRPSNGHGRGVGLLAPYRGAASDGFGGNPLLDPLAAYAPIPLGRLFEVQRNRPEAVLALVASHQPSFGAEPEAAPSHFVDSEHTGRRRWQDELERVRRRWTHNKRQDLTMGLAAFGLRGLKLDFETVKADVLLLATEQGDEELDKREDAVDRTFANYVAGRLVAWREYYARAGLEPPRTSTGSPPPVPLALWHLSTLVRGPWPGRTGLTDMVMYAALVRRGLEHGRLAEGKLLVSVSVRDLQLDANISAGTRQAVLKRLTARGRIARVEGWPKERTHAGAFILTSPSDLRTPEDGDNEADIYQLERFVDIVLHPAFRERALSRSAGCLLAHLTLTAPLGPDQLAQATGLSSETVRKGVDKLLMHELIETAPTGQFRACADILERLEKVADRVGATARRRQQQDEVKREREAFQELWPYLRARRNLRGQA